MSQDQIIPLSPPAIQILHLTRGSVVLTQTEAYACTDAAAILTTVAALLPRDNSLDNVLHGPVGANGSQSAVPGSIYPGQPAYPTPNPEPVEPVEPQSPEASQAIQAENLLRLCDAVSSGRITEEQFAELLDSVCPEIPLDQVQMTRDSFSQRDDGVSQLGEMLGA